MGKYLVIDVVESNLEGDVLRRARKMQAEAVVETTHALLRGIARLLSGRRLRIALIGR